MTTEDQTEMQLAQENENEESKADAFTRIAGPRYIKAMERIQLLEALANRGSYEYTQEQVDLMFGNLHDELNRVKSLFEKRADREIKAIF